MKQTSWKQAPKNLVADINDHLVINIFSSLLAEAWKIYFECHNRLPPWLLCYSRNIFKVTLQIPKFEDMQDECAAATNRTNHIR